MSNFVPNAPSSANTRFLGTYTYAQFEAIRSAADFDVARLDSCTLNITDRPGQVKWYVTPTGFLPFVDTTRGNMSNFKASVNGSEATIANGETLSFLDNGISKFSFHQQTKTISHNIIGTHNDEGKVLTADVDGKAVYMPLPLQDVADTTTVRTFLENGAVKASVKYDTAANNLFKQGVDGSRVDAMTVAAGSENLLAIDPANNTLAVKALLRGDTANTTLPLADWAAAVDYENNAESILQLLDVLVRKDTSGNLISLHMKVASTGDVAVDFANINLTMTVAQVVALLKAGYGINIAQDGTISAVRDTVASRNDLTISANGLLVDIANAIIEGNSVSKWFLDLAAAALTNANRADNLLSYDAASNKIQGGGVAIKNTTFDAVSFAVNYDASAGGSHNFRTDNVNFEKHYTQKNEDGVVRYSTLTRYDQLEWSDVPNS